MPPHASPEEKSVEDIIVPAKTSVSTVSLLALVVLAFLLGCAFVTYLLYSGIIDSSTHMNQETVGEQGLYIPPPITESTPNEAAANILVDGVPLDSANYSNLYQNLIAQEGVSWLSSPKALGDLGLLKLKVADSYGDGAFNFNYYQIGMYKDAQIVFADELPCLDMICGEYATFLVPKDGPATILTQHSSIDLDSEWVAVMLDLGTNTDTDTVLQALAVGRELKLQNLLELEVSSWSGLDAGLFAMSSFNLSSKYPLEYVALVEDTKYGPLFVGHSGMTTDGTVDYVYALRLPGGLIVNYEEKAPPFVADDRVPQITWTDGTKNSEVYRSDQLTGCGGGGPMVVATSLTEPAIKLAGTTISGEKVYNIIDPSNPLIERVFEMTGGIVYEYLPDSGSTTYTVTKEEFIANYGVILIENVLGQQQVFTNSKYGPQAECGKPVIYLYPKATTTVTVKVDALITKSEPAYKDGWEAIAHPDGSLLVEGEKYGSLFWDGYGNGEYPNLTEGFVVPTTEAIATMSEHLQIIGFNEIEIAEFAEFWSDHLPKEPYTRISWIQTIEMEKMARLDISPRPDTLIRAFVDYEGVEEYSDLKPQVLIPRQRIGYTVTEWGGLLRP